MDVATCFINLGIKGANKSLKALSETDKGLKKIETSGLAAKAAIIGAVYALEKITAASGERGMALQQFANSTGLSAEMLQKWQFAAKGFGVQSDEVTQSIKSVQGAMTDMLMGKGAPAGIGLLQRVGFDPAKARDTFYVMNKLAEFSKIVPPDIAANLLKGFGISENMFQFLRMNQSNIEKLRPSNLLGDKEIAQLAKVDVAWSRFWDKLKGMSDHTVAKHGLFAVGELDHALNEMGKMGRGIDKLTKKFGGLSTVATTAAIAIGVAFAPLTTVIVGLIAIMADLDKEDGKINTFVKKNGGGGGATKEFLGLNNYKKQWERFANGDISGFLMGTNADPSTKSLVPPIKNPQEGKDQKPAVEQNNNIHIHTDTKRPEEHGALVGKELNIAMRQLNQGQVV